jgi:energy-converting hydrogenase A subunit M
LREKEEQESKLTALLSSRKYSRDMVNAIYKALNIHIAEKDLSCDDLEVESNYFDESPIPKSSRLA